MGVEWSSTFFVGCTYFLAPCVIVLDSYDEVDSACRNWV